MVAANQRSALKTVLLARDRLRLPAATEGLVDRDDAAIQINLGLGLGIFGRQALTLGIEQHEEVGGAFAVADLGEVGGGAARFALANQRNQPLLALAIVAEGVLRFFQSQ
ncbi:hypothetical protein D9M72_611480 [compost metagenome]